MKVVFMGTPDFSVPVLERLIKEHEVVCVYTRAPKEAGRGKKICLSPVHEVALKHGIEVRTPKTLKTEEMQKEFLALDADVSVVAAYGLILPKAVVEAFKYGCLNVHASLLPRWRGAAPIQRAIESGDLQSGVTIMRVVEALDAGAMYEKGIVPITPDMTGGMLHDKLSVLGAELISDVLSNIESIVPQAQDEALVTYAKKLEKEEEKLDFSMHAAALVRKIRAFNPYPATYFEYQNERFKVLEAAISNKQGQTGEILPSDKALTIACGQGALDVLKIQRQGKKVMDIEELLRGYSFKTGTFVH